MAERKRGCLGCSFPILILIIIVFLALFIIGFLAGPIGQKLIPGIGMPEWLTVPRPEPHLPAPEIFNLFGLPITNTVLAGWFCGCCGVVLFLRYPPDEDCT